MNSSVDNTELAHFAALASDWWDLNGPLRTLHDLNPARLDFIQQHCSLQEARVLDVGCGGGILAEALARCGAKVIGIDAEASAIAAAQLHAEKTGVTVAYQHCTIEDWQGEPVDLMVCLEMLEHVAVWQDILVEAKRVVRPGGLLILSTINRHPRAWLEAIVAAEYVLRLLPRQTHRFDKFIRPGELAAALYTQQFEVVDMAGLGYQPWARQAWLRRSVAVNYLMCARRLSLA